MLVNGFLLILSILLICSGVLGILLLRQHSPMFFRFSQWDDKLASGSITFLDSMQNRIVLFSLTFGSGLLLAAIYIGWRAGWDDGSFSFIHVVTLTAFLISLAPISILFFPNGLIAYLPVDYFWQWYFSVWIFYFVTAILGIAIKQRWFVILLYAVFIIILILNIAGCRLVGLDTLSNLNPD